MVRLFLLLHLFLLAAMAQAIDCVIPHKVEQSMSVQENCGRVDADGVFHPRQAILDLTEFPDQAPACLIIIGAENEYLPYYVLGNGKSQASIFVDNGCDYFEEGLARTHVAGKVAYFDKDFTVKIATEFDEGAPFYYGHAVVCNGPFKEEQVGEHTLQRGGRCGLIDHTGELVVPAHYSIEDRDVFSKYINTHNDCEMPPIKTEADALCHGRRHARHLDHHSDNWTWYQVREKDKVWLIDFIQAEEPETRLTMEIDGESAHWNSIIPTAQEAP
jgi:hypothetical protein